MLRPTDRVERVDTDFTSMPLTPEDFYLLSRIEGRPTVGHVIKTSGLPAATAKEKLDRLVELGALRSHAEKIQLKPDTATSRGGAASRMRRRLTASLAASKDEAKARRPVRKAVAEPPPPLDPNTAEPGAIEFDLVPEDDPRLDPALPIDVERQRDVVATLDRLGGMNHFEILRIMPTSNTSAIKRAYHKLSRHLHPDAYYGKEIGPYAEWLREVFDAVKYSYDLLMQSDKRDEYVERLLEIERHRRAEKDAIVAKEREAEAEAEAEVERRRAMDAALEQERKELEARRVREAERDAWRKEQEGRKKRDRARKLKVGARLLGTDVRRQKAEAQYKQALKELEAGNEGAAAGLLRLAMDLDPSNEEYHRLWQEQLATAQASRASSDRAKGDQLVAQGSLADAAHYYEGASRADPSPLNLALAAKALAAAKQTEKSHKRAMAAIDAMRAAEAMGSPLEGEDAVAARCELADAFIRLGQRATAAAQVELAAAQIPDHPRVVALLKRLKVT